MTNTSSRAAWLAQAGWGVFAHYLIEPASSDEPAKITVDEWNRQVDSFDAVRLADQLEEIGTRYFFLTLGQVTGFFCSPNVTYDAIVGRSTSRLSRRDLIADVAAEVTRRGIRMLTYLPSHAPYVDDEACRRLRYSPTWERERHPLLFTADSIVDDRQAEFQRNWEAVIREWSNRWGDAVSGWWIDGCYHADTMYQGAAEPNFYSFAAAMRSGNPNSIVAFNKGWVVYHPESMTDAEDYTAGEAAVALPIYDLHLKWDSRLQYHLLSYLGQYWSRGEPRFATEFVQAYSKEVMRRGGAITWDIPISPDGLLSKPHLEQLTGLNR